MFLMNTNLRSQGYGYKICLSGINEMRVLNAGIYSFA